MFGRERRNTTEVHYFSPAVSVSPIRKFPVSCRPTISPGKLSSTISLFICERMHSEMQNFIFLFSLTKQVILISFESSRYKSFTKAKSVTVLRIHISMNLKYKSTVILQVLQVLLSLLSLSLGCGIGAISINASNKFSYPKVVQCRTKEILAARSPFIYASRSELRIY